MQIFKVSNLNAIRRSLIQPGSTRYSNPPKHLLSDLIMDFFFLENYHLCL